MIVIMNKAMQRLTPVFTLLFLLMLPTSVAASAITVRPFLIEETLPPRGEAIDTVKITSDYPVRKSIIYATVNEITMDEDGEIKKFVSPIMTDRTDTITSWIEVTRGRIEVKAGETVEVPVTIRVHPYAKPGVYHAFIGFVEAPNRPKAEAIAMAGDAKGVLLKVVISDQRNDDMRIASFSVDRFVTGKDGRQVSIKIENTGDIASAPTGEIIFYDSTGKEVASMPVNEEGKTVAPKEVTTLTGTIPVDNTLGRYKANVSLKYGKNQQASLFDTTYFYVLPFNVLLPIFAGILLLAIFISLWARRVFFGHEVDDDFQEVTMYVKEGHEPQPQDHDIDLKNNQ